MKPSMLMSFTPTATLLAILVFFLSPLKAQEATELMPFNTVKVMGRIDVEFIKSEDEKIKVSAFGDDEKRLKISQQNRTLKLSTLRSLVDEDLDISVKVYYREIAALYVAGGAEAEFKDVLKSDDFYARAGSGSELFLEVDAGSLDLQAAEGAHLTVRGQTRALRAGANTGGILDGHRLTAQKGRLRAGTGGEVSATVEKELSAKANTGGIIRYAGNPTVETGTILGGSVERLAQRKRR